MIMSEKIMAILDSKLNDSPGSSCSKADNAVQRINHYPVDKWEQNKPRYPLDSDLSGGIVLSTF